MPEVLNEDDDRRRSPRFTCGGEARIRCLPSDGALVLGKLRNLSMGGICVETAYPIDPGTRTEILVSVNAASFRTVGLVRAILGRSRTCMEFVQMSAGSKDILADLLGQLARIQRVVKKLRSARVETEAELSRELREAGLRAALFGQSSTGRTADESFEADSTQRVGQRIVELGSVVIKVDLFG